jgi:DNA-binding response OmpR family regulator
MNKRERVLPLDANQTVILLAEDEPLLRNVVRIMLEKEGYFILSAADGEEALYLSRTFPGKIHMLLSDVEMPWMDGLQLRSQVLEERPATRVLLMSGHVDGSVGQSLLRKPFSMVVLRERVREMLKYERCKHRREVEEVFAFGDRPGSNDNAAPQ